MASGLNARGSVVTFHTPNDRGRHERCTRLRRDIDDLEPKRTDLTNTVYELETSIHDAKVRLEQIEQELSEISAQQELARAAGGRLGVRGVVAGYGLAELIALARQKDELEREHNRLRSQLSGQEKKLQEAKRRQEEVDYQLSRLKGDYNELGCGLAYYTPSI